MDIDIKELEAFAGVVEKSSFSRAAESLYLTQPTVSAHIASLERKLGVKLLVRTTKEIYPSDAGNLLYEYAREILRLRSGAVQAIQAFSKEMQGTITIAASALPGQYYLPRLIRDFRVSYPDIHFRLQIMSGNEVSEQISARKADLGFTDAIITLPKCVHQELTQERLVLAVPNLLQYHTCLSTGLPIHQLAEEAFITCEEGSVSRQETDAFLQELGINPQDIIPVVEAPSVESVLRMVSEGVGIAVLPESACEDYRQLGKLLIVPFDSVSLRRTLCLIRHKNSILSPISQAFYEYVMTIYPAHSPEA